MDAPLLAALVLVAPVETYKLPNGMTVLLENRAGVAAVAVRFGYYLGRADEPEGQSGLMRVAQSVADDVLAGLGWRSAYDVLAERGVLSQGSTLGEDLLGFEATVAPDDLATVLWVDRQRARALISDVSHVVLNRARLALAGDIPHAAYALIQTGLRRHAWAAWNEFFRAGPYHHPVADPAAITVESYRGFARFFGATNAYVSLVGDIPVDARTQILDYFGDFPAGPARPDRAMTPTLPSLFYPGPRSIYLVPFASSLGRMSDIADVAAELIADDELISAHATDFAGVSYFQVVLRDGVPNTQDAPSRLARMRKRLIEVRDNVNARSVDHAVRRLLLSHQLGSENLMAAARSNIWDGMHQSLVSSDPSIRYYGVGASDVQSFINKLIPPTDFAPKPKPMAME